MNRLEKHIKNKLQEREIKPSLGAWDKISSELESEGTSSLRKNKYWWAVAAGLTGLILLSIGFFGDRTPEVTNETIVLEEENNGNDSIEIEARTSLKDEILVLPEEGLTMDLPESHEPMKKDLQDKDNQQMANNPVFEKKGPLNDDREVIDLAITTKLEEVLAQVNAMEDKAIVVSDAEIDSLLLNAQKELLTDKVLNKNGKVDAMALLNEVELELYDDQRNPLFIRLKEGFFKLRTAVADRNN
jgi:hypothetical protein